MKNLITFFLILSLFPFTALNSANIVQQQDATYVLRGRVLGGDTNQPLVNASVSVQSVNVSTVTNQDGYFSIRVPAESRNSTLIIRHLGYSNMEIPVVTLIDSPNNHITLVPSPIQLSELQVISGDGTHLLQDEIGRAQSELQSRPHLVCRLLLEKKKHTNNQ